MKQAIKYKFLIVIFLILTLTGCNTTNLLSKVSYDDTYEELSKKVIWGFQEDSFVPLPQLLTDTFCYIPDENSPNTIDYVNDNYTDTKVVVSAGSALCINVTQNKPVFVRNVYQKIYPASTTKLMTALLTLRNTNLDDIVTIKQTNGGITLKGAQLCGFEEGDKVSVRTLLNCMLVFSGNDAAIALAEHCSGSIEAFVEDMNQEADRIGAVDTIFKNPHGIHDSEHVTTAYDMYMIMLECMQYEEFFNIVKQDEYTAMYETKDDIIQYKSFEAINNFLNGMATVPEGVTLLGGKTGSTNRAGECMVLSYRKSNGDLYIAEVYLAENKSSLYEQLSYLMQLN